MTIYNQMEWRGIPRRPQKEATLSGEDFWNYQNAQMAVNCEWCGEQLKRSKSRVEKYENQFCDSSCRAAWVREYRSGKDAWLYKGGPSDYGPGWNEAKKAAVRERDGHTCRGCGRTQEENIKQEGRKLTVHHIQKARHFDDPGRRNAMGNLITLCDNCHPVWEQMSPLRPLT